MPAHQLRHLSLSSSRRTNEDAGRGRFVLEIVLRSGKRSSPSWKIATGPAKSFSRCSPRSVTPPSSNARVAADKHLPTVPRGRDPRTKMDVLADVTLSRQRRLAGVQPIRIRIGPGLERHIPRSPSSDCRPRIGEYIEERIALRVNLDTACESLVHSQQLPTEAARILRGTFPHTGPCYGRSR